MPIEDKRYFVYRTENTLRAIIYMLTVCNQNKTRQAVGDDDFGRLNLDRRKPDFVEDHQVPEIFVSLTHTTSKMIVGQMAKA